MLWDFTSTGTTNQFYLRPHGSTTIGLGCTTSTGANIRISSTYKDVKWTITTSSSYGWQFKSNASSAMYLAVYSDSNWRNYTSSTTNQNGKFHLFKQTSSSTTYYYSYPQCATQTVLSLRPQPAYRHSVKNLLFCKFHHINMSKITLLVCAFACKQLTNIVSKGQPNDPRPKGIT